MRDRTPKARETAAPSATLSPAEDKIAQLKALADKIEDHRASLDGYLDAYARLVTPVGMPQVAIRQLIDAKGRCICQSALFAGSGRRQGARNRISTALLTAFADDFEKYGEETVRITRVEKPVEYLKIAASLLPKEFEITHSQQLQELDDGELHQFINRLRDELRRGLVGDAGERTPATIDGESARLLPALPAAS